MRRAERLRKGGEGCGRERRCSKRDHPSELHAPVWNAPRRLQRSPPQAAATDHCTLRAGHQALHGDRNNASACAGENKEVRNVEEKERREEERCGEEMRRRCSCHVRGGSGASAHCETDLQPLEARPGDCPITPLAIVSVLAQCSLSTATVHSCAKVRTGSSSRAAPFSRRPQGSVAVVAAASRGHCLSSTLRRFHRPRTCPRGVLKYSIASEAVLQQHTGTPPAQLVVHIHIRTPLSLITTIPVRCLCGLLTLHMRGAATLLLLPPS